MNSAIENDLIFDDQLMLKNLIGKVDLTQLSPNNDCDCTNYTSTSTHDEFNTHQIAASIGQTH